jgi:hypothetical protein
LLRCQLPKARGRLPTGQLPQQKQVYPSASTPTSSRVTCVLSKLTILTPLLLADGLMGSGRRARAHEQITHTPLVQLRGYWMASEAKGKPGHQPVGFRCGWASSLRISEHLLVQSNKGVRCAGAPAQEHAQLAWKVPWSVQHRGISHTH